MMMRWLTAADTAAADAVADAAAPAPHQCGLTALHCAAHNGRCEAAAILLAACPALIHAKDQVPSPIPSSARAGPLPQLRPATRSIARQ